MSVRPEGCAAGSSPPRFPRWRLPHRLPRARSPAEPGRKGPRCWRWWSRRWAGDPRHLVSQVTGPQGNETESFDVPPAWGQGARAAGGCPADEGHGHGLALGRAARAGREAPDRPGLTKAGRAPIAAGTEKLPGPGHDRRLEGRGQGPGRSGPRRGQPAEPGLLPARRRRGPPSLRHRAGRWGPGSCTATLPARTTRRQ